jgi:hypothetical protein
MTFAPRWRWKPVEGGTGLSKKQMPGRNKTDKLDARGLATLLRVGTLQVAEPDKKMETFLIELPDRVDMDNTLCRHGARRAGSTSSTTHRRSTCAPTATGFWAWISPRRWPRRSQRSHGGDRSGGGFLRVSQGGGLLQVAASLSQQKVRSSKVLSRKTKKGKHRLAVALRNTAQALHGGQSSLGDYYRRMKAKFGPAKAAATHKLSSGALLILVANRIGRLFGPARALMQAGSLMASR